MRRYEGLSEIGRVHTPLRCYATNVQLTLYTSLFEILIQRKYFSRPVLHQPLGSVQERCYMVRYTVKRLAWQLRSLGSKMRRISLESASTRCLGASAQGLCVRVRLCRQS